MKKNYKLIAAIMIFTIGLLWVAKPIEILLNQYFFFEKKSDLLAGILVRSFISIMLIFLVRKLGLLRYNGLCNYRLFREKFVLLIPSFFILLGLFFHRTIYIRANNELLVLFAVSVILIGLVEELCMRGLVLPLIIKSNRGKKYCLYYGVLISAVIFGLVHYINLYSHPENFWGVTRQVFFAIAMGVFFGALMLRTGNVFVVALCHGCVNFILGNKILKEGSTNQIMGQLSQSIDLISFFPTLAIFCFIIIVSLNMVRKVDEDEIKKELKYLNL